MDVDLFLGIRAAEIGKSQLRRLEAVHGGGGGEAIQDGRPARPLFDIQDRGDPGLFKQHCSPKKSVTDY